MAERAARVTMLQRSPTYVVSLPGVEPIAGFLRRFLPERTVYALTRWKNVLMTSLSWQLSRRAPRLVRRVLRRGVERQLPEGYDVDRHFSPSYNPWDQRLCVVPRGDLFEAIRAGRADVVTDRIETFTERGIRLQSGEELEADVIVTATGLNMLVAGGMKFVVDGEERKFSETVGYKGAMFSGIPNFVIALGYTNASFTLKTDLVAEYVCRLFKYMDAHGYRVATPREPDASVPREPIIDLKSGYVLRSLHELPTQGGRRPWRLHQNYALDIALLKRGPVDDEMDFSRGPAEPAVSERGRTGEFAAVA
jgi:cation diffusion facilitator CzcD-associated flavoprotein CzcO